MPSFQHPGISPFRFLILLERRRSTQTAIDANARTFVVDRPAMNPSWTLFAFGFHGR
jgi:hypothetical protein